MRRIFAFLGLMIALFSVFFVFAAVSDLMNPKPETDTGVVAGLLVFFSATSVGGFQLFRSQSRKHRRDAEERAEAELLAVIRERGGMVTPEEIALRTHLNIDESRSRLDALCARGAGEIRVTGTGALVYVFFGFLSDEEKKSARSVLD